MENLYSLFIIKKIFTQLTDPFDKVSFSFTCKSIYEFSQQISVVQDEFYLIRKWNGQYSAKVVISYFDPNKFNEAPNRIKSPSSEIYLDMSLRQMKYYNFLFDNIIDFVSNNHYIRPLHVDFLRKGYLNCEQYRKIIENRDYLIHEWFGGVRREGHVKENDIRNIIELSKSCGNSLLFYNDLLQFKMYDTFKLFAVKYGCLDQLDHFRLFKCVSRGKVFDYRLALSFGYSPQIKENFNQVLNPKYTLKELFYEILLRVCKRGHTSSLKLLIDIGCDQNDIILNKDKIINLIIKYGRSEIFKILCNRHFLIREDVIWKYKYGHIRKINTSESKQLRFMLGIEELETKNYGLMSISELKKEYQQRPYLYIYGTGKKGKILKRDYIKKLEKYDKF